MEKRKFRAAEVKYLSRVAIDLFEKTDNEVKGISKYPDGPEQNNTDQMNYVADLYMKLIRAAYPLQEDEIRRPQVRKVSINAEGLDEVLKTLGTDDLIKVLEQIFKDGEIK